MASTMIAAGAGSFLFCILVLLFGSKAQKKDKIQSRLNDLSQNLFRADLLRNEEMNRPFSDRVLKPLLRRLTEIISMIVPIQGMTPAGMDRQKKLLMQAGWAISVEEYMVIHVICMICGGLAGLALALVTHETILNTVLYSLAGLFAGYALLRYGCSTVATRRKAAMERQLPDMLDLLSVSVAAGLGFERAMLHIINSMEGPLIDEFTVTYREMTMGRSRKDALALLGERCDVEDLTSVTGALIQAGDLGIPIRNVLQTQADAIRRAHRSRVQEKAAKVSTKILLPMIAFIFPVLIIVLLGPSLITIVEVFQ